MSKDTSHAKDAALHKEAVDRATDSYWSDYFGEYGKALVRRIPRRIKQAFVAQVEADQIKKVGAKGEDAIVAIGSIEVAPIAPPSGLTFEGVLTARVKTARGEGTVRRLFRATLDAKSGEVAEFSAIEVPAVAAAAVEV